MPCILAAPIPFIMAMVEYAPRGRAPWSFLRGKDLRQGGGQVLFGGAYVRHMESKIGKGRKADESEGK